MSECEHTEINRYHDRNYGDFWMCRECETKFVPAFRLDGASALLKRIWEFDVRVEGNGLPMDL